MRTSALISVAAAVAVGAAVNLACDPPPASAGPKSAGPLVDLVDPSIGTGGFGFGYGASFMGASAPHGLVKAGPDTTGSFGEINFIHTSGSFADDPTILCFSHLHLQGTGLPEGGVVALMPTASFDAARPRAVDYKATRVNESAHPGRYTVTLEESGIVVDVATPGPHTAHWSIDYPTDPGAGSHNTVVLDFFRTLVDGTVDAADYHIEDAVGGGARVTGSLHTNGGLSPPGGYTVFFVIEATAGDASVSASDTAFGYALDFGGARNVEVRVALSYVGLDGASRNFAELPLGNAFGDDAEIAQKTWDDAMSRVQLFVDDTNGKNDARMFASAVYRALLMPDVMSDVDGRFVGPDAAIHTAPAGMRMFTDLSLWDTYRTVQPFYSLVAPDDARDQALSIGAWTMLLGHGPLWTMATGDASVMIGSPGELILADAIERGDVDIHDEVLEGATVTDAYDVLRAAALDVDHEPAQGRGGRSGVVEYDANGGWVPPPERAPVSSTLEWSAADLALSRIAHALGNTDDDHALLVRSKGWAHLYDADSGFLRARTADDAGFVIDGATFKPEDFSDDYVEADAWQSLFPLDDDAGIRAVYGGDDGVVARLAELLDKTQTDWNGRDQTSALFGATPLPYHWQGNEPSLHVSSLPYRFGDDALGASFVSFVMKTQYNANVNGLPGNDDGGALSSWWALAACGLFPVAGSNDWIIGAPLFPRVELGDLVITRSGSGAVPHKRSIDGGDVDARVTGLGDALDVEVR